MASYKDRRYMQQWYTITKAKDYRDTTLKITEKTILPILIFSLHTMKPAMDMKDTENPVWAVH